MHLSQIGDILENSLNGKRPSEQDCLRLLESNDVHLIGLTAGYITQRQFGKKASFVNNIILNSDFKMLDNANIIQPLTFDDFFIQYISQIKNFVCKYLIL